MQPRPLSIKALTRALGMMGISVEKDAKGRWMAERQGIKFPIRPDGTEDALVPGMHIVSLAEEFGEEYADIICNAQTPGHDQD